MDYHKLTASHRNIVVMPVQFNLHKIEQLLANATTPKQKAMYEALLTKARQQQQQSSKPPSPSVESPVPQVAPASEPIEEAPETQAAPVPEPIDKASTPQVKEKRGEDTTKQKLPQQDVEKHRTKKPLSISLTQKPQTNTAEPELPPALFQAIGVVTGVVHLGEDRWNTLTIGEKPYPLLYSPQKRFAFKRLDRIIKETGETKQRLIVYPQSLYYPKLEQPLQIRFVLVGVDLGQKHSGVQFNLEDGEFRLNGLWQSLSTCNIPCISIFKNFYASRVTYLEKMEPGKRAKFLKPLHLPVSWEDTSVKPLEYKRRYRKKEEKPAFVQVKARFLVEQDVFKVIEQLEPPRAKAPKFLNLYKTEKVALNQPQVAKEQESQEQEVETSEPQATVEPEG